MSARMTSKKLLLLGIAYLLTTLTSCVLLQDTSPKEELPLEQVPINRPAPSTARVAIEDLKEKKANTLSDIEIVWQIPREYVEGFIIRFGFDKNNLDQQLRVLAKDLEKFEDPEHGFVYRYVIGEIPLGQVVYLSISAFTGEKISKPTDLFEVAAEKFANK